MKTKQLPLKKNDVTYNAANREVSLKVEKFDELMKFIQELLEQSQSAENARDTARARQRRAEASTDVVAAYAQIVDEANRKVQSWVDENTIQELSRRSKIPYATCHRIVRERLPNAKIEVGTLGEILQVVVEDTDEVMHPPKKAVIHDEWEKAGS